MPSAVTLKTTVAIALLSGLVFGALPSFAADSDSPTQNRQVQSVPPGAKSDRKERSTSPNRQNKEEWEKRREELRKLPPEERRAKIREWRRQRLANRPEIKNLTPEERETKLRELRQNLDGEIARLRKLQETRSLSEQESRNLKQMEELDRRFKARRSRPPPGPRREGVPLIE